MLGGKERTKEGSQCACGFIHAALGDIKERQLCFLVMAVTATRELGRSQIPGGYWSIQNQVFTAPTPSFTRCDHRTLSQSTH